MITYMELDLSVLEGFEWDKGNLEHIKKHHVGVEECEEVFSNKPLRILKDIDHSQSEERFQGLGKTHSNRLLFLTFTIRNNKIRTISARDQDKKERTIYFSTGGEDLSKN